MRNDKLPYAGDFVNANNGVTYNLIGGFNKNPNSRLLIKQLIAHLKFLIQHSQI